MVSCKIAPCGCTRDARATSGACTPPSPPTTATTTSAPPPLPIHRPPPLYRRWAEVPLPARVHVHVHGGGTADTALFRRDPSSLAFSAALWRCAGYVPKKFGFRYCEFPSWVKDKDVADALFTLAREKTAQPQAARFTLPLVGNKGNNNAQTLTNKAEGSQQAGDDSTKVVPPRIDAKTKVCSF